MWKHDVTFPSYPMLTGSLKVDVAIVGAGITGLTAAYLLAKSGKSIAVFEGDTVGSGATAYTTGFLTQVIDTDLADAEKIWGVEIAGTVLDGHKAAIDTIEKIVKEEKIDCEFVRCPNYIYTTEPEEELENEHEAAKRLGLSAKLIKDPEIGFDAARAIEIKNQAKIHPLKYLKGLADVLATSGVKIFEHTCAKDIEAGTVLYTEHGIVEAEQIFFATHIPFEQPPGLFFRKGVYITYILELKLMKDAIPEGTYEDTSNPYHYFRVDNMEDHARVLVGGEDHRKDIPVPSKKNEQALEAFVKETFGHLHYTIVNRWKGPILEPSDGLPMIGPYEYRSTFYATGFSGNGLTHGTLAALMFADHVENRDNPWKKIFDPHRIPYLKGLLFKGRDYVEEFWHGAVKNILRRSRQRNASLPVVTSERIAHRSS
jgi:glycine/D-amino acid oxidase-like deaminating enzyme